MQTEPMNLFIAAWQDMIATLPGPRYTSENGVSACLSDTPNLFFNLWFQEAPVASADALRALLRTGKAQMEGWHYPVGGVLRHDWLPQGWEAILAEEGLAVMMDMVGMEAETITPPPRELAAIEVRPIADDEAAMAAAMINARAYHMPEEQFVDCGGMHFFPEGVHGYLGYVDGVPVATAGVRRTLDTAYVFLVATEPEHQGKGYAAATMRHAMAASAEALNCPVHTLHATMAGSGTYRKMGYDLGPTVALVVPAG